MEMTPEDTVRDMQNLLIQAIPGFEYPRKDLYDYEICTEIINECDVQPDDFVMGIMWDEIVDDDNPSPDGEHDVPGHPVNPPKVIIERSYFGAELTPEEVNILAILMMNGWLQRQVTSIENIRMKYSGADFKMTSQANHLQKLLSLQTECQRQSHHMQRLYKRRERSSYGRYKSTWDWFGDHNTGNLY